MVIASALVYLAIASAVPLLHDDDCTATDGAGAGRTSVPFDNTCPACKFVAGSNAMELPCDYGAAPILSEIASELPSDSQVLATCLCPDAIIRRGPPAVSLS
jgi:hypothetical protein